MTNPPIVIQSARRVGAVSFFLRRVGAHLWRARARWSYLVVAFCLVVYAVVPKVVADTTVSDPVQQFLLMMASVAVGGIVLPELPSALWTMDVERVRNLVPQGQRDSLAKALIRAESYDDDWNTLVWEQALQPLFRASREPWRYVRDLDYDIAVHLNTETEVAGRVIRGHTVAADLKAYRVLARDGVQQVHVAMARTPEALAEEFQHPTCIGRELTPLDGLDGAEWQQAVCELCSVTLSIDGVPVDLEPDYSLTDLVRFRTKPGFDLPSGWVKVQINYDTLMQLEESQFPVLFSSYYCSGTTDITMRLYDEDQPSDLAYEMFIGRALEEAPIPKPRIVRHGPYQRVAFSTGRDSILWPGSGVRFSWRPRT